MRASSATECEGHTSKTGSNQNQRRWFWSQVNARIQCANAAEPCELLIDHETVFARGLDVKGSSARSEEIQRAQQRACGSKARSKRQVREGLQRTVGCD